MSNLNYPKGEHVWTGYYNLKHELVFILTTKPAQDYYYLYKLEGEEFKKLGRAKSPVELENKFCVYTKLCL